MHPPALAPLDVAILGPGMITQLQILPSIYQLQRQGLVKRIAVCGTRPATMRALAEDPRLLNGFPGQSFELFPDYRKGGSAAAPEAYREALKSLAPRQCVVVALPDQMHEPVIRELLEAGQHVITVKPFVLTHKEGVELEELAREKGLFVGIEYHKRFDDRGLMARRRYRAGEFGELKCGQAHLIEKYYYMHSNFQNWCTCENSDAFTYIGCHYVDLVAFITGLKPVEVSVHSRPQPWPNGKLGYLWTDARVIWDNGATLNVVNGFGYPDEGPGGNTQGMVLHTEGPGAAGLIWHSDQFRGVKHAILAKGGDPGDTAFMEPNPDYFQLLDRGGPGLEPAGYGYRSIEALVKAVARIEAASAGLDAGAALRRRRELLAEIDAAGILATPRNSSYNELVIEAGRLSVTHGARPVRIEYAPEPRVRFKESRDYGA
ncbi:MAG: Gfo/Idh/MocA family oxidoreductase [Planctomycetota bacterium]|nr:Gfo/Idh/MocA family oxidoreductase [Planctomycetota bacterium]